MTLTELGLYGSINVQDTEVAACQPIVDFISTQAPQLTQFDIRLPDDEQHAVKFEVEFQQPNQLSGIVKAIEVATGDLICQHIFDKEFVEPQKSLVVLHDS